MRWFSRRRRRSPALELELQRIGGANFATDIMITNHLTTDLQQNRTTGIFREIECRPLDTTQGVLTIVVPYTTPELTRAALRHAGVCTDLNVRVSLVDIQIVPFPCPFDTPPVNKEFSQARLTQLFRPSQLPGETAVLYARDWLEGFQRVLEPDSLVILASKKRWWRTREEKLARALKKTGHQVLLIHSWAERMQAR
jgi:hypothetical protein